MSDIFKNISRSAISISPPWFDYFFEMNLLGAHSDALLFSNSASAIGVASGLYITGRGQHVNDNQLHYIFTFSLSLFIISLIFCVFMSSEFAFNQFNKSELYIKIGQLLGYVRVVCYFLIFSCFAIFVFTRLELRERGKRTNSESNATEQNISRGSFHFVDTYNQTGKSEAQIDEFLSGIKVEILPDGTAILEKDLNYYIGRKEAKLKIVVPKGFRTDFASIPWGFQWLIKKHGLYNGPAVLHDWLFQTHKVGFRLANAVMYDAMVEARVSSWRRYLIYLAVKSPFAAYAYWAGPDRLQKNSPKLAEHIVR